MRFRTEYEAVKSPFVINPEKPVVLLGSCFAENIGSRMRDTLWVAENPLGTLYNPFSIALALEATVVEGSEEGLEMFQASLFEAGGMWRSWLFDSKMSAELREDLIYAFRERSLRLHRLLAHGEVLFVTFGTSWCYYLSEEYGGNLVANCHKQPASLFERRRLRIEEIVGVWSSMAAKLHEAYPQLRIVFTVSPVRHLKDGFEGNARSKAILLLAIEEVCNKLDYCHYFPAYEIVNDDLRDYRFYAGDLVHPSAEAVEYIWEIFKRSYIDDEGLRRLKEGEAIKKGLDHRPLPNASRSISAEAIAREVGRVAALEERKRDLLKNLYV